MVVWAFSGWFCSSVGVDAPKIAVDGVEAPVLPSGVHKKRPQAFVAFAAVPKPVVDTALTDHRTEGANGPDALFYRPALAAATPVR